MRNPYETIGDWKKHIKKEKKRDMLEIIKLDLEEERDNYEEVLSEYENLINEVERKLK